MKSYNEYLNNLLLEKYSTPDILSLQNMLKDAYGKAEAESTFSYNNVDFNVVKMKNNLKINAHINFPNANEIPVEYIKKTENFFIKINHANIHDITDIQFKNSAKKILEWIDERNEVYRKLPEMYKLFKSVYNGLRFDKKIEFKEKFDSTGYNSNYPEMTVRDIDGIMALTQSFMDEDPYLFPDNPE